jgi:hypothetical protein
MRSLWLLAAGQFLGTMRMGIEGFSQPYRCCDDFVRHPDGSASSGGVTSANLSISSNFVSLISKLRGLPSIFARKLMIQRSGIGQDH